MTKNYVIIFTIVSLFLVLMSCSGVGPVAGGTSETTSGSFSATVISSAGFPEADAKVYLHYTNDQNKMDTIITNTNIDGEFTFTNINSGEYSIEVVSESGFRAKTIWNSESETPTIPFIVVKKSGRLFGTVSPINDVATISILGLNRTTTSDSTGYFAIDSLPEGDAEVIIKTSSRDSILVDTFYIVSGEAVNLGSIDTRSEYTKDSIIVATILSENGITKNVSQVTKTQNGRISELKIDNIGSKFTIVSSDIQFLRLKYLSIAGNKIVTIPDEIGNIATLEYLDISRNKVTAIPSTIGKLTACTFLDIGNNELSYLPESLLQMSSIEKLYVNANHLVDLPANIYEWVDENSMDDSWLKRQSPE